MAGNNRSYHGQKKRKSIGSATSGISEGAKTVIVDASKGDLFELSTAATGTGSTITFDIQNPHDGQEISILYLSNNASDSTASVVRLDKQDGVTPAAVAGASATTVSVSNLIIVKVFDKDDELQIFSKVEV